MNSYVFQLVVDLGTTNTNSLGLLTIGNHIGADIPISDARVTSLKKLAHGYGHFTNFLDSAQKPTYGVGLLYGLHQRIKVTKKQPVLPITPQITAILKYSLIDLVVFGKNQDTWECEIFQQLRPEWSNTGSKYLMQTKFRHAKAMSISRCSDGSTERFLPGSFNLAAATPGKVSLK